MLRSVLEIFANTWQWKMPLGNHASRIYAHKPPVGCCVEWSNQQTFI